ncbi:MAG: hypothetical protein JNL66_23580 [Alphaproteobacteria bacterium]|nr:hypothetical protein [Alphaproteobacteria bacterium]
MAIHSLAAPLLPPRVALRRTRLPPEAGAARARIEAETIARLADVSDCRVIAAAGEDAGLVLATLLARNPHAAGVAFHDVADGPARAFPAVAGRVRVRPHDGAAVLPRGADAYLVKRALAMRDDDAAAAFLAACRGAVARHARLLIAESTALRDDLDVVVSWFAPPQSAGRARSAAAIAALLREAGFVPGRFLPHPAIAIIEAMPG